MPLQQLPDSAAILVWPPVALFETIVSELRFGSPSCSLPRPPVAGSSRTVRLIPVPQTCHLSFRPLFLQAPRGPVLDLNNYMVKGRFAYNHNKRSAGPSITSSAVNEGAPISLGSFVDSRGWIVCSGHHRDQRSEL